MGTLKKTWLLLLLSFLVVLYACSAAPVKDDGNKKDDLKNEISGHQMKADVKQQEEIKKKKEELKSNNKDPDIDLKIRAEQRKLKANAQLIKEKELEKSNRTIQVSLKKQSDHNDNNGKKKKKKKKGDKDDNMNLRPNTRIVNGDPVQSSHEFPFVVDLSESDIAISSRRFCTGTLIDRSVVLTAAHCVINQGYFAPVYATVGRVELEDGHVDNKHASTYRTVASMVHPLYDGIGSPYDVAVLLLNSSCESASPVALAEKTPSNGSLTWVVGFGIQHIGTLEETARPVEILAGRLQKSQLQIVPRSDCDIPQANLHTKDGLLCTRGVRVGASACMGDSGGGLFSLSENHSVNAIRQVGIVSYGDSQCASEESGVFTDVAHVRQWIRTASSRLHSLIHRKQFELRLDDGNAKEEVIYSDNIGGKILNTLHSNQKNNNDKKDDSVNVIASAHNVKSYKVKTNFSQKRNVTVSLCKSGPNTSAQLSVEVEHRKGTLFDYGSCPGGKLSRVVVPNVKNEVLTVGVSGNGTMAIQMALTSVQADKHK